MFNIHSHVLDVDDKHLGGFVHIRKRTHTAFTKSAHGKSAFPVIISSCDQFDCDNVWPWDCVFVIWFSVFCSVTPSRFPKKKKNNTHHRNAFHSIGNALRIKYLVWMVFFSHSYTTDIRQQLMLPSKIILFFLFYFHFTSFFSVLFCLVLFDFRLAKREKNFTSTGSDKINKHYTQYNLYKFGIFFLTKKKRFFFHFVSSVFV